MRATASAAIGQYMVSKNGAGKFSLKLMGVDF